MRFWEIYSTLRNGRAVWVPSREAVVFPGSKRIIVVWMGGTGAARVACYKGDLLPTLRAFLKGDYSGGVEMEPLPEIPADADPLWATDGLEIPKSYRLKLDPLLMRHF